MIFKKNRMGVVLLTTIGLILLLSILVLNNIDISKKYIEESNKNTLNIQLNRAFLDILKIFEDNSNELKDSNALLSFINRPYFVDSEDGKFNIIVDIESASGIININNLFTQTNETNKTIYNFLQILLHEYQVKDSSLFLDIVLDSLDMDDKARIYGSEISYNESRFGSGSVITKQSFSQILDYYVSQSNDANIYKVPWGEIIGFYGDNTDFNYIKEQFLNILKKQHNLPHLEAIGLVDSIDELSLNEEVKKEFKELGIVFFAPTIFCEITISYQEKRKSLNFLYDMQTKRANHVQAVF